jgi:hypothetical protein
MQKKEIEPDRYSKPESLAPNAKILPLDHQTTLIKFQQYVIKHTHPHPLQSLSNFNIISQRISMTSRF